VAASGRGCAGAPPASAAYGSTPGGATARHATTRASATRWRRGGAHRETGGGGVILGNEERNGKEGNGVAFAHKRKK
jgi:hypothetical protein